MCFPVSTLLLQPKCYQSFRIPKKLVSKPYKKDGEWDVSISSSLTHQRQLRQLEYQDEGFNWFTRRMRGCRKRLLRATRWDHSIPKSKGFFERYEEERKESSHHHLSGNGWKHFWEDFKCNHLKGSLRDITKYTQGSW